MRRRRLPGGRRGFLETTLAFLLPNQYLQFGSSILNQLANDELSGVNPMKTIYLVANGDLRLAANQMCEEAQASMEKKVVLGVEQLGDAHAHRYHVST